MISKQQAQLQYILTEFSIAIGMKADKGQYNAAWSKMWKKIHALKILPPVKTCVHR